MLRAALAIRPAGLSPQAVSPAMPDFLERIEAWVASYLDGGEPAPGKPVSLNEWQSHAMNLLLPQKVTAKVDARSARAVTGWQRITIFRKPNATVVRLKDRLLLKQSDLQDVFDELTDLIEAGSTRILLDFQNVERLSCGILPLLATASRRCSEDGLGGIRVCNIHSDLAPVFGLSPLTRTLSPNPTEEAAATAPWPGGHSARPLPEALLAGLLTPKLALFDPNNPKEPDGMTTQPASLFPFAYRLIVTSGKANGRSVKIPSRGLLFGRDSHCEIRSDHAFLSRRHARLFFDQGRLILRDLGSTNGTLLNGKPVETEDVEALSGDLLQIGPLKFMVAIDPRSCRRLPNEEEIADWLGPELNEETAILGQDTVYDVPASTHPLRLHVIENVLVLTPLAPELLSGPDVSLFRNELAELLEASVPHRVVVNLKLVPRLSNAAVGLLVAHHVHLDRLGGALRLCEPHIRVAEVLNQIRLPLLLDVYVSEDEAVLSAWEPQKV